MITNKQQLKAAREEIEAINHKEDDQGFLWTEDVERHNELTRDIQEYEKSLRKDLFAWLK